MCEECKGWREGGRKEGRQKGREEEREREEGYSAKANDCSSKGDQPSLLVVALGRVHKVCCEGPDHTLYLLVLPAPLSTVLLHQLLDLQGSLLPLVIQLVTQVPVGGLRDDLVTHPLDSFFPLPIVIHMSTPHHLPITPSSLKYSPPSLSYSHPSKGMVINTLQGLIVVL